MLMPALAAMKLNASIGESSFITILSGVGDAGFRSGTRLLTRAGAHRFDRRRHARRLGLFADDALQLGAAVRGLTVGGMELDGALVFGDRAIEIALRLELLGAIGVRDRGGFLGPFERDLVLRPVRILLHGAAVVLDGGVPVSGAGGFLAAAERPARAAGRHHHRGERDEGHSFHQAWDALETTAGSRGRPRCAGGPFGGSFIFPDSRIV